MKFLIKQNVRMFYCICSLVASLLSSPVTPVWADTPFLTDDPNPVDYSHWEVNFFSFINHTSDVSLLQAPVIQAAWGVLPALELSFTAPMTSYLDNRTFSAIGLGDIETAAKYRLMHETAIWPQIAIAPALDWATGNGELNTGNGGFWMKLPIWLQKSWGAWTTYGGGGYIVNTAANNQNAFYGGFVVQKAVNQNLNIGAEIFSQGQSSSDASNPFNAAYTVVDIGVSYQLSEQLGMQVSCGYTIAGQPQAISYVGVSWAK